MHEPLEVGSTFSGVGGLDLGLERAGHTIVFQCESDERCRGVLARHWPGVPCWKDVVYLRESAERGSTDGLREATDDGRRQAGAGLPRRVDLLCGGFPCQDLSVAGRRAGLAGERSGLFFEFARIADELVRPGGWILVENVPGLLSSHGGRDFALLLATLADLGFHDCAWRVLDSRYFGVPQRRRRVFILGRRAVGRSACEVLLEPEGGGGDFAPRREAGARVAASATRGSSSAGVSAPGRRQEDDENLVNAIQHPGPPGTRRDDDAALVARALTAEQGQRNNGSEENFVAHTLRAEGFDASEDGTGRGTPLTVAGALGGGNDGAERRSEDDPNLVCAPVDPDGVRAATGLPRRVDDPQPDGPRYAMMGNAVTVPVAEWIGWRLREIPRLR